ncbi:MAG: hypothetical protein H8E44_45610 [Planctomycetes bacterium]|nr:hypothetical protein [Planctomycetota bacterium]
MLIVVTTLAFVGPGAGYVLGETWSDSTGKFQVEAQFLGIKANKVYLKKDNGVVIAVPLDRLSAASQQLAQQLAAPAPGAADSPDGTIRTVMTELEQGNVRVVWDALPPSYQSDVNDLVHTFADNMDAELWNAGAGLVKKVVRILKEKKQFILAHPAVAEAPVDADTITANWDTVVDLLDTIVNSEITDLEKLKTIDVGAFLSGSGKSIGDKVMAVAQALEGQDFSMAEFPGVEVDAAGLAKLKDAKISTLSVDGDTATVRIEKEGGEVEDIQMVHVEGKWLPKEMVDGWATGIGEAKAAMTAAMGEELKKNKQQVLMPMRMVGMVLDGILATQTQEEFNDAIDGIKGMLTPEMEEGGGDVDPFGGGGGADPFGGGATEEAAADPFGG